MLSVKFINWNMVKHKLAEELKVTVAGSINVNMCKMKG